MNIGIIQTRKLGDIIIALPVAKYYADQGLSVYWPVDRGYLPSLQNAVDYVNFIPVEVEVDSLEGYYEKPVGVLSEYECKDIFVLYSFLSNHQDVINKHLSRSLKFDEYKYAISGVPFREKWNLSIKRDLFREEQLYNRVVGSNQYIVVHDAGHGRLINSRLPDDWKERFQIVEITPLTGSIFDWLTVLEKAAKLVLADSCFANLVEQLALPNQKYFVARSPVGFTPVLKNDWSILSKTELSQIGDKGRADSKVEHPGAKKMLL